MKRDSILTLCYMAFYAALYVVLWYVGNFIPVLVMPDGGSIELELIALFVATFHLGWKRGLGVAALSWALCFICGGEKWFVTPIQYCLDYFVPLAVIGMASIFAGKSKYNYVVAIVVGMLLKWFSNVLSGVFFYFPEGSAAGSLPAWINSVTYNSTYNIATLVVCAIVVPLLINALKKTKKIQFVVE